MKLVSTILCCHKINDQLFDSINSVLAQTYLNHELIVIFDNDNKDEFNLLVSKFIKKNILKIKFYQNKKNMGLTYSLNKAISLSKGEYIMRQDSDDISENHRMINLVDYLNSNPNKDLVFSNVIIINDENKFIKYKKNFLYINKYFSTYNFRNTISHPSIMFKKNILKKIKIYDERFKVSQDYELIHKILKNSRYSVGKLNKYLYKLRYSKNSISSIRSSEQLVNSVIIIFIYNYKFFEKYLNNFKSTEDMIGFIEENMKTYKQYSIYYSYLIFKKIPFKLLLNPLFIFHISYRYLFHPNLLIKRIFRLI